MMQAVTFGHEACVAFLHHVPQLSSLLPRSFRPGSPCLSYLIVLHATLGFLLLCTDLTAMAGTTLIASTFRTAGNHSKP